MGLSSGSGNVAERWLNFRPRIALADVYGRCESGNGGEVLQARNPHQESEFLRHTAIIRQA